MPEQDKLKLSEYDICDLHIRCVEVFVNTASRLDFEKEVVFANGKKLWKETLEILKEYRKDNP